MRFIGGLLLLALIVVGVGIAFGFIDLHKTQDGALPEIAVKEGKLPQYQANVATIDVGTETRTIEVPKVEVNKP
ncbi:MAG: hypothetical protein ABW039_08700 [Sphingobium sp.]